MTDEITAAAEPATVDKPLAHIAEVEQQMPQPAEPMPAAAQLRAFEDANFGKNAVRINGRVERGSGSPYHAMSPVRKKHYQALENLIDAEQKLADAHTAVIAADAAHEQAMKAVDVAAQEADAASDE